MTRIQIINLMRKAGYTYLKNESDIETGRFDHTTHKWSIYIHWEKLTLSGHGLFEALWPSDLECPFKRPEDPRIAELEANGNREQVSPIDKDQLKTLLRGLFQVYEKNIQGDSLEEMLKNIKAYKPQLSKKVESAKTLIELVVNQNGSHSIISQTIH